MNTSLHSQDWLALLLYGLDMVLNPKPYKWLETFEEWDYRTRLRPQLYQLQRARFLERHGTGKDRVWSLTPQGRLAASGGIDPPQRWQRPWDGKWRLLMFDLPARSPQLRLKLWRWLRRQRFGLLQQSVWATPDPVDEVSLPLDRFKLDPSAMMIVEAQPVGPTSDAELVASAWNLTELENRYRTVLDLAARGRQLARRPEAKPVEFGQWLAAERLAWLDAVQADPFLPARLLPPGYLGREAWAQRQAAYAAVAERGLGKKSKIVE